MSFEPDGYQEKAFQPFPKIARFNRQAVITEKIDGTNACVFITDDGADLLAQSRKRIIVPGDDNFGFAAWVEANREELLTLGPGRHFGEWWGPGIQRGYGLAERKFSLFNTHLWSDPETRPACCDVVPVLWQGEMLNLMPLAALEGLRLKGSVASPGFMQPEGIVIFHAASNMLFKMSLEGDLPKGDF